MGQSVRCRAAGNRGSDEGGLSGHVSCEGGHVRTVKVLMTMVGM